MLMATWSCFVNIGWMTKNLVLHPPEIVDVDGRVVFLAGPIQGTPDWQARAAEHIHFVDNDIVIASPRKDYLDEEFIYEAQVDWETHFLNRAAKRGGIMFWLASQTEETPGRAYAQTSRFELGEWKVRYNKGGIKLVVGIEEGFGNARYIRRRFEQDCPNVPIYRTLLSTCVSVATILK